MMPSNKIHILLVAFAVAVAAATPLISRQKTPLPPNNDPPPVLTCANTLCAEGTHCVMINDQPRCIPNGDRGEPCGSVICPLGTECCNPLRSTCVKPGGHCLMMMG